MSKFIMTPNLFRCRLYQSQKCQGRAKVEHGICTVIFGHTCTDNQSSMDVLVLKDKIKLAAVDTKSNGPR